MLHIVSKPIFLDQLQGSVLLTGKYLLFCFTGPNVGIAVSGGGFRAALYGAGTFSAFDGRNDSAVQAGTGGVWQLATYMTGLSGGSWFVGSLAINNAPSIQALVLGSEQYQG